MPFNIWTKKWLIAVALCLLALTACSLSLLLYILMGTGASSPKYVVNQVRLAVNPMMLYLEQNSNRLDTEEVQTTLQSMAEANQTDLMVVQLDGTVSYSSNRTLPREKLNLRTDLHYDLHDAIQADDRFRIAFPIIDEATRTQTGNVIFDVPEEKVLLPSSRTIPLTLFLIATVFSLISAILLMTIRRKLKRQLLAPIHTLKQHAEAILRGHYEEPIQHSRSDEVGELYAMFDLMRTEIRHLSTQRMIQEQAQKELVTNISHELKTPITTIKAYMDAILEGVCSDMETLMEYVEVMRSNTDKMARLVEDLLIHALQELGQISVEPREQYSQAALVAALKPIGHYVRTSGVAYIPPRDIPNVLIRMDAVRMEQVIVNLISNALKHTAPGDTIQVETRLEPGQLKITIADTGKGIRAQDMPFIFERYFRGRAHDPRAEQAQTGTGLGLSICKTIIEAHGGQISFKSKEGQGTSFHFTLPTL